uniref:Uncharacterized protein n=1 Tax=Arundo donax TaxID=35708 RepID=A0A0A9EWT5_ARUDO
MRFLRNMISNWQNLKKKEKCKISHHFTDDDETNCNTVFKV